MRLTCKATTLIVVKKRWIAFFISWVRILTSDVPRWIVGMMVFTSSAGVYATPEGACFENGELAGSRSGTGDGNGSLRITRLLDAEYNTTSRGGCVVRLAGLYHLTRGAHSYYLSLLRNSKDGGPISVDASGHTLLNLIHYDDAASLVLAALLKGTSGEIYVGADMHPINRIDMMHTTIESGSMFKDGEDADGNEKQHLLTRCRSFFAGPTSGVPLGKELNNMKTRTELDWLPEHESFKTFMGKTVSNVSST